MAPRMLRFRDDTPLDPRRADACRAARRDPVRIPRLTLALVLLLASGVPAWAQAPIEDELVLQTPVSKFIVDAALKAVVREHGGMSAAQAEAYVSALARDKRYVRDVY